MRTSLLISLFVLFFGFTPDTSVTFDKVFPSEFHSAYSYVQKNKNTFTTTCKQYGNTTSLLTAIVFPELMRYDLLSDFMETMALELVYVQFGSKAADFSVGRFQMKPSFAESIEMEIEKNDALRLKYADLLLSANDDLKVQRSKRVERLKNLRFQLKYANAFLSICEMRFSSDELVGEAEKVKLYSTAYNAGYYNDKKRLNQLATYSFYPYGRNHSGNQYPYWKVSQFFSEYASSKRLFCLR